MFLSENRGNLFLGASDKKRTGSAGCHHLVNKEGVRSLYPFRSRDQLECVRVGHGPLL